MGFFIDWKMILILLSFLLVGFSSSTCPPGTYNVSGSICEPCPPGYYQNVPDQIACIACPINKYSLFGSNQCINCPLGKDTKGLTGSSQCINCEAGTFNAFTGSSCIPCPNNTFSNAGSITCQSCPVGTENAIRDNNGNIISSIGSGCTPCFPGWYSDSNTSCLPCPPGSYSDGFGKTDCLDCPTGSVAVSPGSQECEICPPGTFSVNSTLSCSVCENGTFSGFSSVNCFQCPSLDEKLPGFGIVIIAVLSFLLAMTILVVIILCTGQYGNLGGNNRVNVKKQ